MPSPQKTPRRTLNVRRHIIGPPAPRPVTVVQRRLKDYPGVSRAHRDVASKLSSPLMLGPPICNELMDFVQHLFTEEGALSRRVGVYVDGRNVRWLPDGEATVLDEHDSVALIPPAAGG